MHVEGGTQKSSQFLMSVAVFY